MINLFRYCLDKSRWVLFSNAPVAQFSSMNPPDGTPGDILHAQIYKLHIHVCVSYM